MMEIPFHFHPEKALPEGHWTHLAVIPSGIMDEDRLLKEIAEQLDFPEYFGFNWDALDDCLDDFEWLRDVKEPDKPINICIWHKDIPLMADANLAKGYLHILRDNILPPPPEVSLPREPDISLMASFPESCRKEIKSLLGEE